MESTFNFLNISINGFSWYEHIANQEDQTTADKKKKETTTKVTINSQQMDLLLMDTLVTGHFHLQTLSSIPVCVHI